jgi:hypothetical protein
MNTLRMDGAECRLQIGDVCCALRFDDTKYAESVRNFYKDFLSLNEPDIMIDIKIVLHNEEIEIPSNILMSKTVDGNNFNFHSGLITGNIDPDKRQCTIHVKNALLKERSVRIFEQFLIQVYYTILKQKNSDEVKNKSFVHGCAVSRNGQGFLFSGPSGTGKSTIAKLSSDFKILNDELVIVNRSNGNYVVSSSPFKGDFKNNINGSVPLSALFLIKHGKKNMIRKITKTEFVTRFVREVIYSDSLLSTKKKESFLEMMDFCSGIAEIVPFYELAFLPDKSFWECIKNVEELT